MTRNWRQERVQNVTKIRKLHSWAAHMVLESPWQAVAVSWGTKTFLFFSFFSLFLNDFLSANAEVSKWSSRVWGWNNTNKSATFQTFEGGSFEKTLPALGVPGKCFSFSEAAALNARTAALKWQSIMDGFWIINRPLWKECEPLVVTEQLKRTILFNFSSGMLYFYLTAPHCKH